MPAFLLTPPAAEPLSLADAKNFLRVEHDDDDAVIAALVASARNHVEALTRCGLIAQSWRLVLDRWPASGRIAPRIGPLRTVTAARVFDAANVAASIDTGLFVTDLASNMIVVPPWSLPPPGRCAAGIELELGIGEMAADVPPKLVQAIRMLVAHWYENRGLIAIGQTIAIMPASVNAMIASWRVPSL